MKYADKFGRYDTELLQMARAILVNVENGNHDSSRKIMLLDTVISKLDRVIEEHGERMNQDKIEDNPISRDFMKGIEQPEFGFQKETTDADTV